MQRSLLYISICSRLNPYEYFTHIYPLKITIGLSWGDNSIICIDNGDDVHSEKFMKCSIEVSALLLIVEIQIGYQNLQGANKRQKARHKMTNIPRKTHQDVNLGVKL